LRNFFFPGNAIIWFPQEPNMAKQSAHSKGTDAKSQTGIFLRAINDNKATVNHRPHTHDVE